MRIHIKIEGHNALVKLNNNQNVFFFFRFLVFFGVTYKKTISRIQLSVIMNHQYTIVSYSIDKKEDNRKFIL